MAGRDYQYLHGLFRRAITRRTNRGPAYDGFARTIASDIDQGAADARYLYEVVKAQTPLSPCMMAVPMPSD